MSGGAYPSRSGLIVAKMMPNAGLYVRTQPRKIAISSTMAVINNTTNDFDEAHHYILC